MIQLATFGTVVVNISKLQFYELGFSRFCLTTFTVDESDKILQLEITCSKGVRDIRGLWRQESGDTRACSLRSVLRQGDLHRVRSSAFSTKFQYFLFFPRSSSNGLRFSAPSCLCLIRPNVFYKAVPKEDVTKPVSLSSFYCT
jgi:hypothetical protein